MLLNGFPFQNNTEKLNPSQKMDLDFLDFLEREKVFQLKKYMEFCCHEHIPDLNPSARQAYRFHEFVKTSILHMIILTGFSRVPYCMIEGETVTAPGMQSSS